MFEAVVIGVSAGGVQALKLLLGALPSSFPLPVAIVQHIKEDSQSCLADLFSGAGGLHVKEAEDKEMPAPGAAYLAPPGYHLLIEPDKSFSLSVDEKVNYCRPSIDLLFESAADAYGERLIGVILTGANGDGAQGLKTIKEQGGYTVVQNPKTAESPYMPTAAMAATRADCVADLEDIAPLLLRLSSMKPTIEGGHHAA